MILKALRTRYKGEIESALANIQVYRDNPVAIGEHPDLVSAVDSELKKLAHAEDMLNTLIKHYPYEAHGEDDPEKNQETLFG